MVEKLAGYCAFTESFPESRYRPNEPLELLICCALSLSVKLAYSLKRLLTTSIKALYSTYVVVILTII